MRIFIIKLIILALSISCSHQENMNNISSKDLESKDISNNENLDKYPYTYIPYRKIVDSDGNIWRCKDYKDSWSCFRYKRNKNGK